MVNNIEADNDTTSENSVLYNLRIRAIYTTYSKTIRN